MKKLDTFLSIILKLLKIIVFIFFVLSILKISTLNVSALDFESGEYIIQYQPSDSTWSVNTNTASSCSGPSCTFVNGTYQFRSRYIFFGASAYNNISTQNVTSGSFDYSFTFNNSLSQSFFPSFSNANIKVYPSIQNVSSSCTSILSSSDYQTHNISGHCTFQTSTSSSFSYFIINVSSKDSTLPSNEPIYSYGFNENINITLNNFNITNFSQSADITEDLDNLQDNIISNNNSNTQDIINNQDKNNQELIESQQVCEDILFPDNSMKFESGYLSPNGNLLPSPYGWKVSDYISLSSNSSIFVNKRVFSESASLCFYDSSKSLISCLKNSVFLPNSNINIPDNSRFFRFSYTSNDSTQLNVKSCKDGNTAINDSINDVNDSLNDSNVDEAAGAGSNFFSGFSVTENATLTSIVRLPLQFLNSLSLDNCSPINLPLPKLGNLEIPCAYELVLKYFPSEFTTLLSVLINGIIAYRGAIVLFFLIEDLKNPQNTELEVFDL